MGQGSYNHYDGKGNLHVSVVGVAGTTFSFTPNNPQACAGNTASGGADSGYPVKVGGVYNSCVPTLTTGQRGDLQVSAGGVLYVGGNVASGATDAGNPLKIGGVYNTTLPTLTNGQRGDAQLDAKGRQLVQASGDVA